ncbi:hypothetical protein GGR54DRAFT_593251 [Hypoxylon sp. NC1633]|nr:hypothetical protein GGR54DRAFT_593251 [Hypoxylon sp. NC1633]
MPSLAWLYWANCIRIALILAPPWGSWGSRGLVYNVSQAENGVRGCIRVARIVKPVWAVQYVSVRVGVAAVFQFEDQGIPRYPDT